MTSPPREKPCRRYSVTLRADGHRNTRSMLVGPAPVERGREQARADAAAGGGLDEQIRQVGEPLGLGDRVRNLLHRLHPHLSHDHLRGRRPPTRSRRRRLTARGASTRHSAARTRPATRWAGPARCEIPSGAPARASPSVMVAVRISIIPALAKEQRRGLDDRVGPFMAALEFQRADGRRRRRAAAGRRARRSPPYRTRHWRRDRSAPGTRARARPAPAPAGRRRRRR